EGTFTPILEPAFTLLEVPYAYELGVLGDFHEVDTSVLPTLSRNKFGDISVSAEPTVGSKFTLVTNSFYASTGADLHEVEYNGASFGPNTIEQYHLEAEALGAFRLHMEFVPVDKGTAAEFELGEYAAPGRTYMSYHEGTMARSLLRQRFETKEYGDVQRLHMTWTMHETQRQVITYTFRTLEFDAPKLHPVFFQIVEFEREVSVAQRSFELELERQHVTLPANVIDFETARSARASITEASVDTEVGVGGKHDTVEAAVEFVTGQYSTGFVSE